MQYTCAHCACIDCHKAECVFQISQFQLLGWHHRWILHIWGFIGLGRLGSSFLHRCQHSSHPHWDPQRDPLASSGSPSGSGLPQTLPKPTRPSPRRRETIFWPGCLQRMRNHFPYLGSPFGPHFHSGPSWCPTLEITGASIFWWQSCHNICQRTLPIWRHRPQ